MNWISKKREEEKKKKKQSGGDWNERCFTFDCKQTIVFNWFGRNKDRRAL